MLLLLGTELRQRMVRRLEARKPGQARGMKPGRKGRARLMSPLVKEGGRLW
jgi:hypothetical protein